MIPNAASSKYIYAAQSASAAIFNCACAIGSKLMNVSESAVSKTGTLKAVAISALVCHSYLVAVSCRDTGIDK